MLQLEDDSNIFTNLEEPNISISLVDGVVVADGNHAGKG